MKKKEIAIKAILVEENMRKVEYIYLMVRKDLPSKEQCLVQAAHAAMEAGIYFGKKTAEPYTFCVLQAENESELKGFAEFLTLDGIAHRPFYEPDQDFEMTAVATEPITEDKRRLFRTFEKFRFKK